MTAFCTRKRGDPKVPAGEVIFTESQVWTVPKGVKTVDVFLVGGGAAGRGGWYADGKQTPGSGGNGGYTKTVLDYSITPLSEIPIVIGAGGIAATDCYSPSNYTYNLTSYNSTPFASVCGTSGGSSYFGAISVDGGEACTSSSIGRGGSGGGRPCSGHSYDHSYDNTSDGPSWIRGNGAINGNNAISEYNKTSDSDSAHFRDVANGLGQGTTTRAFGESTGTIYGCGGGGGSAVRGYNYVHANTGGTQTLYEQGMYGVGQYGAGDGGNIHGYEGEDGSWSIAGNWSGGSSTRNGTDGTPNTGGGGGGGYSTPINGGKVASPGGNGGSGIVIVRWAEQ